MAGPVYHFDSNLDSDIKLPEYFDDTLFVYDWSRRAFWEVKLDESGDILKINRIWSNLPFARPIDAELGPDGAMYVLEWGSGFGGNNADAQLSRVEFVGNLPTLLGDYNQNNVVDAADYTIWRDTLGQTGLVPFSGADSNADGRVNESDWSIWKSHFGDSLPGVGNGSRQSAIVSTAEVSSAVANLTARPLSPGIQSPSAPLRQRDHGHPEVKRSTPRVTDAGLLAWLATRSENMLRRADVLAPLVDESHETAGDSTRDGLPSLAALSSVAGGPVALTLSFPHKPLHPHIRIPD
jgi:hypothetical protein